MQVCVRGISGNEVASLRMRPEETAHDLQVRLAQLLGIPVLRQQLLCDTGRLESNKCLSDLGLQAKADLTLVVLSMMPVVTASVDRNAKLWNPATGECTQILTGHGGQVRSAVFSADGTVVLTASDDCTAKLWDPATGECTQTLAGHGNHFCSAVFSGDGTAVVTVFFDRTAKLWNPATGECTQTLTGHGNLHMHHRKCFSFFQISSFWES